MASSTTSQKGATLICVVESLYPFGAFVRLGDGSRGYIRKRELSLSGETDPRQVLTVGQEIRAVVLESSAQGRTTELSVKATCPDPWPVFLREYRPDSPVSIMVKYLYSDGVLAEIVPGVDGFIPLGELTLGPTVQQPEDILWPGDHSEAVITRIDHTNRKVQLSIRRWAKRLVSVEPILAYLHRDTRGATGQDSYRDESLAEQETTAKIALPGPVLVVEDQESLRRPLVEWLTSLGCVTCDASSAAAALELCSQQQFTLAIIDLDLPEMNGAGLIRELRRLGYGMGIAVMSGPDLIADQLPLLRQANVVTAFPKPLDQAEIRLTLLQMARGERPTFPIEFDEQLLPKEVTEFSSLATMLRGTGGVHERLQIGLEQLARNLRANLAVIFRVDLSSRTVSVVAQSGQFLIVDQDLYDLINSPVKDVIVEGNAFWENRVSASEKRFRKLLDIMPFESCIGIPLEVGGRTEHALFLFQREPDAFTPFRLRDAIAYGSLFCAALESQGLEERLQAASRVLLSGQLASAFGHEVYNKVSGLDLQISNVRNRLVQTTQAFETPAQHASLESFIDSMAEAVEMATELKRTVQDFQRLTRSTDAHMIDVNQTIFVAKTLVSPLALRQKVEIRLDLADGLPYILGSGVRLQQVFLNLMLNAVQQMANQPEERRVLRVTSVATTLSELPCVNIRVIDTGPGIHKKLWEKVFALGFTTRKDGSGLGLFIGRSLIESMGGTIAVEESLIQLETTFLVTLPAAMARETAGGPIQ